MTKQKSRREGIDDEYKPFLSFQNKKKKLTGIVEPPAWKKFELFA